MLRYIRKPALLLGICMFSFLLGSAQDRIIKLEPLDSIRLSERGPSQYRNFGQISVTDSNIIFLYSDSGKVIYYNRQGIQQKALELDGKWRSDIRYSGEAQGYFPQQTGFIIFNDNGGHLYYFSKEGKRLKRWRYIDTRLKRNTYEIYPSSVDVFETGYYDDSSKKILLHVIPSFDKAIDNNFEYDLAELAKVYSTPGLIGVFNDKGKLENVIGEFDDVYRDNQYLLYLNGIYTFFEPQSKHLYIVQEASPLISVYDLQGRKINTIGAGTIREKLPTITSRDQSVLQSLHFRIITNNYKYVFHDSESNLTYRVYAPAAQDTTKPEVGYDKLAILAQMKRDKVGGCPRPSTQEIRQQELLDNKPHFLQVFDGNRDNKLIAEVPISYPFKILKSERDILWVHAGFDHTRNEHLLIKYKIALLYK